MTIIKTIEERKIRVVHAAGEAGDRDRSEVTCGDCLRALAS